MSTIAIKRRKATRKTKGLFRTCKKVAIWSLILFGVLYAANVAESIALFLNMHR